MIINKWWFYLIDVMAKIKVASLVGIFIIGMFLILRIDSLPSYPEEWEYKAYKREGRFYKSVLVALILVVVTIPNKETMISMKIAEFSTYENVEITVESIKGATDYIFEKIKEVK